jgi:hypothetical protein
MMREPDSSSCNKEQLPEQWKGSIIVPMYEKGVKKSLQFSRYITVTNCMQNFTRHSCF